MKTEEILIVRKFIRSIKSETLEKIRGSKGDAECRRVLFEEVEKLN